MIGAALAGFVAVPLLGLAVAGTTTANDASHEADRIREQVTLAEGSFSSRAAVSEALVDELAAAATYLMGLDGTIGLSTIDNTEARHATDEAVAHLRATVEAQGGKLAEAYGPALEQTTELQALRAAVDSAPDTERSIDNPEAMLSHDGYAAILDAYDEAGRRVSASVYHPDLRRGRQLVGLGARQDALTRALTRELLLAAMDDGLNNSDEISSTAQRLAELTTNDETIASTATGDYREPAEQLSAADHIAGFRQVVEDALSTGLIDVQRVVSYSAAGDDPDTFGYAAFQQEVTRQLVATAEDIESAASDRRDRFAVIAVVAVLTGIAALVTMAALLLAARSASR